MKRHLARLAVPALLLAGCWYPGDRGKQLEARVDKLEVDNKQLAEDLIDEKKKLAQALPPMNQAIADLQARLDKLDHAARTSDADIGVQMEGAREDIAKLRGMVEEYQHRIDTLDTAIKQLNNDTNEKFAAIKGPDALKKLEAEKSIAKLPRPADKTDFLKLADNQLSSGNSDAAVELYNEFLQKWPKDPLAANAHYSLGKYNTDQNHCREALSEYGEVIKKFPKSEKAPPSLLASSDCFATLGMSDESRLALEELTKDYPNSQEGKQAKERLKKKPTPKPTPKKGSK
jgi:tol-pal system protein YbgF